MIQPYGKNVQFSHLLKAEGKLREFNFRRGGMAEDEFYSVDVSDDRGNRIFFKMTRQEGLWRIVQEHLSFPVWILGLEQRLHELILESITVD